MSLTVVVLAAQSRKWYNVFAKDNEITHGYLASDGPYSLHHVTSGGKLKTRTRQDLNTHTGRISVFRRRAQSNLKGSLLGDTFVPRVMPLQDLFLEYFETKSYGRSSQPGRAPQSSQRLTHSTEYSHESVSAPRVAPRLRRVFGTKATETTVQTLIETLDRDLASYCLNLSKRFRALQPATVSMIWRMTADRSMDPFRRHRIWKARSLLLHQLETRAQNLPPKAPFNLDITTDIMEFILGPKHLTRSRSLELLAEVSSGGMGWTKDLDDIFTSPVTFNLNTLSTTTGNEVNVKAVVPASRSQVDGNKT